MENHEARPIHAFAFTVLRLSERDSLRTNAAECLSRQR
jgi:hypothetical protein